MSDEPKHESRSIQRRKAAMRGESIESIERMFIDEPNCVCGHAVSCHDEHNWHAYCQPGDKRKCDCQECRAAYSWPTEEGYWWCDIAQAAWWAAKLHGEIKVNMTCPTAYIARSYFEKRFGPALFTKLIEPNPFARSKP